MCLPFTVRVGEGVGRYVVATRDIKAGQVILMIMIIAMTNMARMMMMIMTKIMMTIIITKIMIMITTRMMMQVSQLLRGLADSFSGQVGLIVMEIMIMVIVK